MIKYFFIFLLFLYYINATGQTDTIIAYDVESQTINVIPPIEFDTTIAFDRTSFSFGSLSSQISLSLTPPTLNLFSGSEFSNIEKAESFFNLTDYPIRTATRLFRYTNDTLGGCCSGIMVSKNLVLTAAHCIRNSSQNTWRGDSIFIAPVFNNGELQVNLPSSIVKKYYIFKKYYDGDIKLDFALLELKEPIGQQIGWVGMAFNKDTSFYSNNVFHKLSYPGVVSPCYNTKIYNGDTLYYNYGKIKNYNNNNLIIHSSEACGIPGQSGSSFLYTDNSIYYSVGIMIWSSLYQHYKISNNVYYQLKNIMDNYAINIPDIKDINSYINISPNPTSSIITIQTKFNKNKDYDLNLFNIQGVKVLSEKIQLSNIYTLDLSKYDNGVYFIILQNNEERMVQKVVIQR